MPEYDRQTAAKFPKTTFRFEEPKVLSTAEKTWKLNKGPQSFEHMVEAALLLKLTWKSNNN